MTNTLNQVNEVGKIYLPANLMTNLEYMLNNSLPHIYYLNLRLF
jgi:hypothetical protein